MAMRSILALTAALLLAGCQPGLPSEQASPRSTGSLPDGFASAADAVVEAFLDHRAVAIGEIHGSHAIHTFFHELLGDPRLVGVLNDIAVEFGSARHQAMIDGYVRGDDLPEADLELAWTDTTQRSGVWNSPVYREFFERIRALNAERRPDERIRVLLGDPPIDWSAITDTGDCNDDDPHCLDHWLFQRDVRFAEVVRSESLSKGRRVLVIAGAGHVRRHPKAEGPRSLTDELDASHPGSTWSMLPVEASKLRSLAAGIADWETPSFAVAIPLAGSPLADLPADAVFDRGTVTCDNPPCEDPNLPRERLGDVADALLVL